MSEEKQNNDEFLEELKELIEDHKIENYSFSFLKNGIVQHSQNYLNAFQMMGILEHGKKIIMERLQGAKNE